MAKSDNTQHSRGISRGLEYSDFFRDHLPQHFGDVRREFVFCGLEMRLEQL